MPPRTVTARRRSALARLKTDQARSLWTRLLVRYLLTLVAFTIVFFIVLVTAGTSISRSIGNYIADSTSEWRYATVFEFNDMMMTGVLDGSNLQVMELGSMADNPAAAAALGASTLPDGVDSAVDEATGFPDADVLTENEKQKILGREEDNKDTLVAYRDLSTYNSVKIFKPIAAIVLYILGLFIITIFFMRRPVRSVDAISDALASPGFVKGEPVTLPVGLKTTQTELELLQTRIVRNEMAARAAEERKNELVTYLAHDIRTPLTSVTGYLELISEGEGMSAERQRDFAGRALVKAERLGSLVEELFEITRYNMQNIPIERERLDVGLLCEQVAEEFYPQAQARGLSVETDVQAGLDAFLDSSRIGRVLENLMKNAVAHASTGSAVVMRASASEEDQETLVLSVSNEGKEIAPEHLAHVFDRFYRGDVARGQATGGAGLGLAIAKEIVEAHGGSIEVTSEGGLTTFTMRLPRMCKRA